MKPLDPLARELIQLTHRKGLHTFASDLGREALRRLMAHLAAQNAQHL